MHCEIEQFVLQKVIPENIVSCDQFGASIDMLKLNGVRAIEKLSNHLVVATTVDSESRRGVVAF